MTEGTPTDAAPTQGAPTDAAATAVLAADGHFLMAFEGTSAPDEVLATLRAGVVPGVTLFRFANVDSPAQVAELTRQLEDANGSDLPLLIGADQETGQLMGLGDDTTAFPGAMALGATGDVDLARRVAIAIGHELRAMGVTMDYAPVCDVATNPANPALGVRAFGDDAAQVAAMAAATAAGLAEAGVVATAKHFPGAGEAVVDPHHTLPPLDMDREHLDSVELAPFAACVDAGAPAVMVGHYDVPAVTGRRGLPSSVSDAIVAGLLRTDMGFDGVVVTDALDMKALPQGTGQVVDAVAALRAGVDLLLCAPTSDTRDRLRQGLDLAIDRGVIDAATTTASQARIERLRQWLATFPRPDMEVVGCDEHGELALEVARRATTLVRDADAVLPLPHSGRLVAVMPQPVDLTPADTSSTVAPGLAGALRQHHDDVVEIVVDREPTPAQLAEVVAVAGDADGVVLGTIWAGPAQARLVDAVLATGTPTVTVALRTPFDLAAYPRAGTHLCTYSLHPASMHALADVLFGLRDAPGRLPAAIPGLYPTGHGLVPEPAHDCVRIEP
ncbi:MAG TPA: glycoside hydrolase family 3 N-terminal domain-containing protein [Nitriliruptoraceae bacterium]|nr:glycoside hydrolase family 3 N-terminal domain-containing protein [Nitriliruptoraceae bacterium]